MYFNTLETSTAKLSKYESTTSVGRAKKGRKQAKEEIQGKHTREKRELEREGLCTREEKRETARRERQDFMQS
jgi:hypothetical protein